MRDLERAEQRYTPENRQEKPWSQPRAQRALRVTGVSSEQQGEKACEKGLADNLFQRVVSGTSPVGNPLALKKCCTKRVVPNTLQYSPIPYPLSRGAPLASEGPLSP